MPPSCQLIPVLFVPMIAGVTVPDDSDYAGMLPEPVASLPSTSTFVPDLAGYDTE